MAFWDGGDRRLACSDGRTLGARPTAQRFRYLIDGGAKTPSHWQLGPGQAVTSRTSPRWSRIAQEHRWALASQPTDGSPKIGGKDSKPAGAHFTPGTSSLIPFRHGPS